MTEIKPDIEYSDNIGKIILDNFTDLRDYVKLEPNLQNLNHKFSLIESNSTQFMLFDKIMAQAWVIENTKPELGWLKDSLKNIA